MKLEQFELIYPVIKRIIELNKIWNWSDGFSFESKLYNRKGTMYFWLDMKYTFCNKSLSDYASICFNDDWNVKEMLEEIDEFISQVIQVFDLRDIPDFDELIRMEV